MILRPFVQHYFGPLLVNSGVVATVGVCLVVATHAGEGHLSGLPAVLLAGLVGLLGVPLNLILSARGKNTRPAAISYAVGALCCFGYVCWFVHQFDHFNPKVGG
jgi:drug/metabolite transporter (DMT)-like permease